MNNIIVFSKNFSNEYKDYVIRKIPQKYRITLNRNDHHLNFLFDRNTFGYVYGSKEDENLERIKFNYSFKNEPHTFDIDDLYDFLIRIV